jgi:hypothetical protein
MRAVPVFVGHSALVQTRVSVGLAPPSLSGSTRTSEPQIRQRMVSSILRTIRPGLPPLRPGPIRERGPRRAGPLHRCSGGGHASPPASHEPSFDASRDLPCSAPFLLSA